MRYLLIALALMCSTATTAFARVDVSIGINLPVYPRLVAVPGYPVYYAPGLQSNYFFYDGLYWVYENDNWYSSTWYNGPWGVVDRFDVPLYVLRVPVRYYRHPPSYFRGWRADAAPRWGDHWGRDWEQRRAGWNQWNRGSTPRAAPLPTYQRQYSGDRYPRSEQQVQIHNQGYRYQPREAVVQQHYQQQRAQVQQPQQSQQQGRDENRGRDRGGDRPRGQER
jgi:hypothetical protein